MGNGPNGFGKLVFFMFIVDFTFIKISYFLNWFYWICILVNLFVVTVHVGEFATCWIQFGTSGWIIDVVNEAIIIFLLDLEKYGCYLLKWNWGCAYSIQVLSVDGKHQTLIESVRYLVFVFPLRFSTLVFG